MTRAWRSFAGVLLLGAATAPGFAQDTEAQAPRSEFGVRYWLATGSTRRSHDASAFDPTLANPTSTLTYSGLQANIGELYARQAFGEDWHVKGNIGIGRINNGTFTDQDFFFIGGAPFMTQTVSSTDGKLGYVTVDVGREVWRRGGSAISVFAGFQEWNESVDGHGLSDSFGPFGLGTETLVIRNELTWRSLRMGAEFRGTHGRTTFRVEGALVPYATYRNEDSHFLRQDVDDLGPVPNVIATGHGWGGMIEAELRRRYPQLWDVDLSVGYRYWQLDSTKGTQTQAGFELPIVDLRSVRHGVLFAVTKSW